MSNIQKEIGARLRNLREKKGLKQKDLSDILGVTPAAYGKFESGDRGLSSETCIVLADFFGVTCDYILRGIEAENVDVCRNTALSQLSIESLISMEKERRGIERDIRQTNEAYISDFSKLSHCSITDIGDLVNQDINEIPAELRALADDYWKKCNDLRSKLQFTNVRTWIINAFIENPTFIRELSESANEAADALSGYLCEMNNNFEFVIDYNPHDDIFASKDYKKHFNASQYAAYRAFSKFFEMCSRSADLVLHQHDNDPESAYIGDVVLQAFEHNILDSNGLLCVD